MNNICYGAGTDGTVAELKTDVAELKTDVVELKTDVTELLRTLVRGSAGALALCI